MKNPYLTLLFTSWKHVENQKNRFLAVYLFFLCSSCINAIGPFLYGWFVGAVKRPNVAMYSLAWMYAGAYFLIRMLEWAFHGPARVMERKLAFHISATYLKQLSKNIISMPASWHRENHSGATINRIKKAHAALRDFFQNGFTYFQTLLKFLFSFTYMLYASPVFGTLGVLTGLLTFYIITLFDKPFIRSIQKINKAEDKLSTTLFDSLTNIVTVISLRLEQRANEAIGDRLSRVFPHFEKNIKINEWKWFTANMLVSLIYVEMVLGFVYQNFQKGHDFPLDKLVILLGFVAQFTSVFYDFAQQYTQIIGYNTDVSLAFYDDGAMSESNDTLVKTPTSWNQIVVDGLSYMRPEATARLTINPKGNLSDLPSIARSKGIQNIHLDFTRGKRIALVGESGCGKSTLLALLRGMSAPHAGTVYMDDVPVSFKELASAVSLFPQEPEIFESSIRYNLTLGLSFSEDEILEACKVARFDDVLQQLRAGLDTVILEKGSNLSGGQKQRLAIARGLLASGSSSIVLLDEPTSSLDAKTEQQIYQNLFQTFATKTVISSLHRLHLLCYFDYVYVLEEGRVVEEGTYDDLIHMGAHLGRLLAHQFVEVRKEGELNRI